MIEIKGTINVICLNNPETIPPPWSVEKLFSTKPVPGAKNTGDHCLNSFKVNSTVLFSVLGNLGCPKQKYKFYFLQQSTFFHDYMGHTSTVRKIPLIS